MRNKLQVLCVYSISVLFPPQLRINLTEPLSTESDTAEISGAVGELPDGDEHTGFILLHPLRCLYDVAGGVGGCLVLGKEVLRWVRSGINHVFPSNVVLRSCRSSSRHGLSVESLHIVKLHDSIVVLSPPPLRLPLVEQLSTATTIKKSHLLSTGL